MENNYQLSRIHNYVNGLMSKDEMHALEDEALNDPFLQDAIDGYKLQQGVDVRQLSLLQQRLATRIEDQSTHRNKRFYSWQRLAIGMAAGVMFIIACSLILLRYIPRQQILDMKEVVMKDAVYEYEIITKEGYSVSPVGGWDVLYEILNKKYSNSGNYSGELTVRFNVDENKRATDIMISGDGFESDEELIDVIRKDVKWDGEQAYFILIIKKIDL